jgi:molybdopterin/thiamine biosynthesis adenylyltransferase
MAANNVSPQADFQLAPSLGCCIPSQAFATQRSASAAPNWTYDGAFCRNRGLLTSAEQHVLRNKRVAIAGLGGVGGVNLVTLARIGIGRFTIADPDCFDISNTNRQYGAAFSTLGQPKTEVMARIVRDINPDVDIRLFAEPVDASNVHAFLQDSDVFVDSLDAFEIPKRRLLFRLAAERGIFALGAGPVGFGTAWVIFDPAGMSFDRYFDLSDDMDAIEQFAAYIVGMVPRAPRRGYMDLSHLDFAARTGPSAAPACQLAGGVIGIEVLKILLNRGPIYPAPYYHQFDAYLGRFVRRRLRWANRHPLQRLKRWWLCRYIRANCRNAADSL